MTIGPEVKALLWDLDGTLIDSFQIFSGVLLEVVALNSLMTPEEEAMRSNFHGTLEDSIRKALALSDPAVFAKVIDDFLRIQEDYYHTPDDHISPDALDLARRAKAAGLQQVVVTNRAHRDRGSASPRHIVEHSVLKTLIGDVICSDDTPFRKPDKRVMNDFLGRTGLRADQLLVIGDQHVDAELAFNLGAPAVLISRSGDAIPYLDQTNESHATVEVVTSLTQVLLYRATG